MGSYDFILDNMKFSYSSLTNFINCPYGFYLTYIECVDRSGNWYSDFGTFIHEIMEKYFKGELDYLDLPQYFSENYGNAIKSPPPPYPANISDKYFEEGMNFFNNFYFNKDRYEVVNIEDFMLSEHEGNKFTIRPDLILREKEKDYYLLMDYKTSNPYKNGKLDKKKIEDYKKQMFVYAYFINKHLGLKIDRIKLWFIRYDYVEEIDYNEFEAEEIVKWISESIKNIKDEENFPPTDYLKKNKFFCDTLCSVKRSCKYINEIQ